MRKSSLFGILGLCILATFVPLSDGVAVMSVDLGAEYMKVAIVKPGVPMEIVLNKESSRKSRTLVAFRDGERQFANQAYTTGVRFPRKAFWYLTHIIGRHFDDPQVDLYRKRFPYYNLVKDEDRGTVLFKLDEETFYSPEELLGMILESAREYASDFAEQPVKDAVITVPAFFNQAERRAVMDAAQMVGLNVLQLMSDNAAVALNYGVFRRKNFNSTMQYYIFYDMGSTSTVASVVGYQVVKMKEGTRVETNPQVSVKGIGFDRTLGGLDITLKLRDHLAKVFNSQKKTKTDVLTNERAMGKLLKEADRVKHILSANTDHFAQVEGLLDEQDFKAKVTREELEGLVSDLFSRVTKPIEDALKTSEITLGEITDVILMGGGTRMPKIQETLMKYLGRQELGKSINTDEAAAMGAVYQAAFLGKGFKVKTFSVKEGNIYPIVVEFEKHKTSGDGTETSKMVKRTLFGRMNPYPQRKVMTFNKHFADFNFNVGYGDMDFLSAEDKKSFKTMSLMNVSLAGVEEAYGKHGQMAESKGIKAHFKMDESGILHLDKVESVFEKQPDPEEEKKDESAWSKIGSALGGLFGSSDKTKEDMKEGSVETDDTPDKDHDKSKKSSEGKEKAGAAKDDGTNKTDSEAPESSSKQSDKSESSTEKKDTKEADSKTKTPETSDEQKEETETSDEQKEETESKEEKKEEAESKEEKKEETSKEKNEEKQTKDDKKNKKDKKKDKSDDKKDTKGDKKSKDKKDDNDKKEDKEKVPEKPKLVTIKEDLNASTVTLDLPSITSKKMKTSKKKLADLKAKDLEKVELEKAKNDLEAYIFDAQDKLSQDDYSKCSTEQEREGLLKQLSEASDWLYDQPEDSKKEAFIEKRRSLIEATKNVVLRVRELQERPRALEALKSMLNHSEYFLKTVKNLTKEEPIFTEVEITTLEKLINTTYEWQKNTMKEQKKLKPHENPKLVVEDIALKVQALDREVKYLLNKAKHYKPKPKPKTDDKNDTKSNDTVIEPESQASNETKEDSTASTSQKTEDDKSTNQKTEDDKSTNQKTEDDKSTNQGTEDFKSTSQEGKDSKSTSQETDDDKSTNQETKDSKSASQGADASAQTPESQENAPTEEEEIQKSKKVSRKKLDKDDKAKDTSGEDGLKIDVAESVKEQKTDHTEL